MNEEERPNYYAVIPACVRYDTTLPPSAKLLYGEICALSNKEGKCWPTNAYFQRLYGVGESTIRRWISTLAKRGYISLKIEYKGDTKEIERRTLSPLGGGLKNEPRGAQKCTHPGFKNEPQNNTSINNNIGGQAPKRFVPPSVDEVRTYCEQRHNGIDPEYFVAFYERNGWRVGKSNTKMQSWKATVITWEKNNKAKAAGGETLGYI